MDEPDAAEHASAVEQRDVHGRPILAFAAVLVASLLLILALTAGLLRAWHAHDPADSGRIVESTAPLQRPAPQDEREMYFAEKQRLLDSYGWVDRRADIARIPVSVAMEILAARSHEATLGRGAGGRQ